MKQPDPLVIAGQSFASRLLLGTAGYPNRQVMLDALAASGAEIATASIRRVSLQGYEESLVELLGDRVRRAPQHRGLPDRARGRADRRARARSARDQLGEARSDRRPRDCSIPTWPS